MIDQKNVITMKVPFPNIDSGLAARAHMYICMKDGTNKEFIKCQSFKPGHLSKGKRPYQYLIEQSDINRNPFNDTTTIDCDKSFRVDNIVVNTELVTKRRKDVCVDLFTKIKDEIKHKSFVRNSIDISEIVNLNQKISSKV